MLERIWNLSDTQQAGALTLPEFVIAMHLLTSYKNGAMRALPTVLPLSLFDAASRLVQQRASTSPALSQTTTGISNVAISRHFSGQGVQQPQSPLSTSLVSAPLSAQPTGSDWAISATDKAQFDNIFSTVDKANRGYISGEDAVRFFGNSKLPAEVLAQIWDLACIQSNGQLNSDEFAVAMYLIRQQRTARDGGKTLPTALPPNLIPPSMRQMGSPLAQSLMAEPAAVPVASAADDLLGLDAPAQHSTDGSASANPNVSKIRSPEPWMDQPVQPTPDSSVFRPFVPSSSWGQNMVASHSTGLSKASERPRNASPLPSPTGPSSASDDLLGDNDPEISRKLTAETTELANLSNQISSLSNEMREVNSKKTSTENELSKATTHKRDFEIRLAQLRSVYEQELEAVRSLEERLHVCRNENKKLLQDLATIEGTHEDLRLQHRQTVSALETDQQENAQLKEKIRTINAEMEALKPQLEKIRSDARQTKGLVAINKKQLVASEGERDRLQSEVTEASKGHDGAWPGEDRGLTSSEARHSAAEAEFSPAITSPSTNPFARFSPVHSPGPDTRDNTGPPTQQHATTFDDLFGPSFHPQSLSPPSSTSFVSDQGLKVQSSPSATVPPPASASEKSYPSSSTTTTATTAKAQEAPSASKSPLAMPSRNNSARSLIQHSSANPAESVGRLPSGSASGSFVDSMGVQSLDSSGVKSDTIGGGLNPRLDRESASIDTSRFGPLDQDQSIMPRVYRVAGDEGSHEASKSTTSSSFFGTSPSPPARAPLPGAFPSEFNSPMVRTPVEERNIPGGMIHQQKNNSNPDDSVDMIPPTVIKREISSGNDDFDAAFANFEVPNKQSQTQQQQQRRTTNGMSKKKNGNDPAQAGGSSRQIDREFPPIRELELDESDSSSSDHGFDDNFTPISPHQSGDKLDDGTVDHLSSHPSKAFKSPLVPPTMTAIAATTTGGSDKSAFTSVSSAPKELSPTEPMLVKSNSTARDTSIVGSLPMTVASNTSSTTRVPFSSDEPTSQSAPSPPPLASSSSHLQPNRDIQPAAATAALPVTATTSQDISNGGSFGDDDAFNEDDFKDLTDARPEQPSSSSTTTRDGKNVHGIPDFGHHTGTTSGVGAETGTGTGIGMSGNGNGGGGGGGHNLEESLLFGGGEEEISLGEDFDLAFDLSRPGVATTTTTDVAVLLPPFTSS